MDLTDFKNYEHIFKQGALLDTLVALVEQGPLWDGNVPSKIGRDEMIALGLGFRTLVNGEDGFTAPTYKARDLYCYYFGKSNFVAEAKAFRLAKRAING